MARFLDTLIQLPHKGCRRKCKKVHTHLFAASQSIPLCIPSPLFKLATKNFFNAQRASPCVQSSMPIESNVCIVMKTGQERIEELSIRKAQGGPLLGRLFSGLMPGPPPRSPFLFPSPSSPPKGLPRFLKLPFPMLWPPLDPPSLLSLSRSRSLSLSSR
jgi:hypothetical protein